MTATAAPVVASVDQVAVASGRQPAGPPSPRLPWAGKTGGCGSFGAMPRI